MNIARIVKLVEKRPEIIEFAQAVHLDHLRRGAAIFGPRRADRAVARALWVEQVEFQFNRQRRRQAHFGKAVDHQPKHMARVEIMRLAVSS